ncbi:hypothetical protein [Frankia sp. R82]|uniref:hypothetical protein n=1 Tax=Frankia sp. R82 TaxID=2950553 RepID=UPI00204359CB|nr:hypothetical protein [Frankia sp. R82]MCM3883129.1 hypothetical protein [Frankia sp. R82]
MGSLKGSPGATTLSLALADRWPLDGGDPVVVEADPAGGDVGARFTLAPGRGLVSLAAAGRRGEQSPRALDEHFQELPGGLQVLCAPAGAEQARQVVGELGSGGWSLLRAAAQAQDRPLIVDCGRLDPLSPAGPLLGSADVLLLIMRARNDELSHLAARMPVVQGWGLPAWYVVVVAEPGRSQGHRVREISRVLGPRVLGPVPYDTDAAGVLAGRRRTRAGIGRTKLGRTVAGIAGALATTAPAKAAPPARQALPPLPPDPVWPDAGPPMWTGA